jgi:hypothetical protein
VGEIRNGNVFLVNGGWDGPPRIYSSFKRAEEKVLASIRSMDACGFGHGITCVQVDTNLVRRTEYWGDITIKDGFKYIKIKRDPKNHNGCKKIHREKIRISLDY